MSNRNHPYGHPLYKSKIIPKKKNGCRKYFYPMLCTLLLFSIYFASHHAILDLIPQNVPHDLHGLRSFIKNSEEKFDGVAESFRSSVFRKHEIIPTVFETSQTQSALNTGHHVTKKKRKRLAYIITITKDGFFQDGAAVLAYSIIKYSQNTSYDVSFIAFVHPTVVTSRKGLRKLGFHVIEVPTPINTTAIKFEFLREKIDKNGCCGAKELIKLTSYRLSQYHRVIHLDADTMMLNPIVELFDRNYSLIYSTDPNMATYKGPDKMPVQGGFIVMQPSNQDYLNLINILMTTPFNKGSGWNRTKIGWFWGGMTVQGVLPYYYNLITTPNRSQVVDRCYYNTMADTPECIKQELSELKSAHFTVCQKPWTCYKAWVNPLCKKLHMRWFEMRKEAEEFYGIKVTPSACPKLGKQHYITMDLVNAKMPISDNYSFIVPDDSPAVFNPIPESMYIGSNYN